MINIRATQLESFVNCAFRYRYEPDSEPDSMAFKFGTTLHKIIEMYVEGVENQDAVDILLNPRGVKERKILKAMVEVFMKHIEERELTFVLSEYSLIKRFDNIKDEKGNDSILQGTFDLLFKDKDGKYIIVDIKTASSAWTQEHIDGVQQKRIYPALLKRCNGLDISKFEYRIMTKTLTPKLQEVSYEVDEGDTTCVEGYMKDLVEANDSLVFSPNYPNYACFFCKVKEECKKFR